MNEIFTSNVAGECNPCSGAPFAEQPSSEADKSGRTADDVTLAAPGQSEGRLSRWLDLDTLSFSMRYKSVTDTDGFRLFGDGQQRSLAIGTVKLDSEGKYGVHFRASSGRYFNWAYADFVGGGFADTVGPSHNAMPAALHKQFVAAKAASPATNYLSGGWAFYLRELYFSAKPIDGIELQYGSLGFNRGVNTEITSYDNDGYMAGERLIVRKPKVLFVDELSATWGYVGDFTTPNFFERGNRLMQSNYHQFLASKHLGRRLDASVDYTWHIGTDTMREALLARVPESKFLDKARVELYQRTNAVTFQGATYAGGDGFAITGTKTLFRKFMLEGGYADVDRMYPVYRGSRVGTVTGLGMNADTFLTGDHLFARANMKINPYVTFFGFYSHDVSTPFYTDNRQAVNAGFDVDFKELLSRKAHLF